MGQITSFYACFVFALKPPIRHQNAILEMAFFPTGSFSDTEDPLPALAFADDVCLLAKDIHAADRMVQRLVDAAALVGPRVNFLKTIVLSISSMPVPDPPFPYFPLIKACNDFCCLDSSIAFRQRRRLAWVAIRSLQPIFQGSSPERIKIRLFQAVVELYSSMPLKHGSPQPIKEKHDFRIFRARAKRALLWC
jgi:hypothetical protein